MPLLPSGMFFGLIAVFALYSVALASQIPLDLPVAATATSDPPLLKLPYATYLGTLNDDILTFPNVRYAAPPTSTNRWQTPQSPATTTGIQSTAAGGACYQAKPTWIPDTDNGDYDGQFPYPGVPEDAPDPQEDCLFLDVFVPLKVYLNPGTQVPVLFWIFGGGYVFGYKETYDGTLLIQAAQNSLIYVRANYRLGAFGFLAGSSLTLNGGIGNAGFWDQRAALEWIYQYIGDVGGNPESITVMGQSAGAGSIMHHLTAPSTYTQRFQRAILQSPAFFPQYDATHLETQLETFATAAGCPTGDSDGILDCLRTKDASCLSTANQNTVGPALHGQFVYGPAIDNAYVPDLPGVQIENKVFHSDVDLLLGHVSDEGFEFTPLLGVLDTWLRKVFPNSPPKFYTDTEDTYYPASEYATEFQRISTLIAHAAVTCNTYYMSNADKTGTTYNYEFATGTGKMPPPYPGLHGYDLCWTFGPDFPLPYNICGKITDYTQVPEFRNALVNFATTGNPNLGVPVKFQSWTTFGSSGEVLYIHNGDDFEMLADPEIPSFQCDFWQKAPYRSDTEA